MEFESFSLGLLEGPSKLLLDRPTVDVSSPPVDCRMVLFCTRCELLDFWGCFGSGSAAGQLLEDVSLDP